MKETVLFSLLAVIFLFVALILVLLFAIKRRKPKDAKKVATLPETTEATASNNHFSLNKKEKPKINGPRVTILIAYVIFFAMVGLFDQALWKMIVIDHWMTFIVLNVIALSILYYVPVGASVVTFLIIGVAVLMSGGWEPKQLFLNDVEKALYDRDKKIGEVIDRKSVEIINQITEKELRGIALSDAEKWTLVDARIKSGDLKVNVIPSEVQIVILTGNEGKATEFSLKPDESKMIQFPAHMNLSIKSRWGMGKAKMMGNNVEFTFDDKGMPENHGLKLRPVKIGGKEFGVMAVINENSNPITVSVQVVKKYLM